MDAKQISGLGRKLKKFLSEFDDCFVRREPREHLGVYVRGQLSNLPRKSIALQEQSRKKKKALLLKKGLN